VLLREKLQEVEDAAAQDAQKPLSRVPPPQEDEAFMLAEKLAEELGPAPDTTAPGSDVLDVEQVFAQFKKGVEETIGLEDSDTHFDLGIAYKEMGLLDDAIHEFELSMTNPQRECIAHTMIGLCFVEKGEIADAISHFKKGLYADNKTDREELGLYFELGAAYELLHDPKEALYYYQKVAKRDPTFRNVIEKLRALTRPQQPTQSGSGAKPTPQMDDVDRAFDDLMGEGD
jgi:pilus assembly protein FimV